MKNKARILLILAITLAVLTAVGVYSYLSLIPNYLSTGANEETVTVEISEGDSLRTVANTLHEEGVIRNRYWFRRQAGEEGVDRNIRPGTYEIPPEEPFTEIFEILQVGEQRESVAVTFPEGFTLYEMGARVEDSGLATREEFIEATEDYYENQALSFDADPLFFSLEGYLYPDTYHFDEDQSAMEIVEIMANRMNQVFTTEDYELMDERDLSLHEILTKASLIERETAFDEESDLIAGVIENRLNQEMRLQIDASVIYAVGEGEEHITRVLYEHLEVENPYNTYRYHGLPPGPIAAPRESSIRAALEPAEHDYLFYVVGTEGHVFAETYDEHLENVAAYREMQDAEEEVMEEAP
ncbi:endolytic transglycosylase MltG [Isachenkonia alkalipeptolytica]|uniref:Endolytic murein transglycosylase n=1 Tax=Isachenkonia alkalipeptolytica TaxID=2565777 RepID=A0AA43XMS1_9CLOT|nr:endolytic transglycosylase MltG [Isachenkonia alkalipeptolytica]NBG89094.1 endolytic transglycosylase MltG [Isachenkonia alkalipeptolytica]